MKRAHCLTLSVGLSALVLVGCSGDGDHGPAPAASRNDPQTTPRTDGAPSAEAPAGEEPQPEPAPESPEVVTNTGTFRAVTVANLKTPWAMTFLPDGNALVTERTGDLQVVTMTGEKTAVSGVPLARTRGKGGLGDVILAPDVAATGRIYISFAEGAGGGRTVGAVARGRLVRNGAGYALRRVETIWRQDSPVSLPAHYSYKLAFSPDGEYLFITSGDRLMDSSRPEALEGEGLGPLYPAQDLSNNLGAIVRIRLDGSVPDDNPFVGRPDVADDIWSYGHRNVYGLAFDAEGTLWEHEMGPAGGDEFQRIEAGRNYGWPTVSFGRQYTGPDIPDHDPADPTYRSPELHWGFPSVAPSSLVIYDGDRYPGWKGDALVGGLAARALVRVDLDCAGVPSGVCEAERFEMNDRIREVEVDANGIVYVLTDGADGRLLRLEPTTEN